MIKPGKRALTHPVCARINSQETPVFHQDAIKDCEHPVCVCAEAGSGGRGWSRSMCGVCACRMRVSCCVLISQLGAAVHASAKRWADPVPNRCPPINRRVAPSHQHPAGTLQTFRRVRRASTAWSRSWDRSLPWQGSHCVV